MNHHKFSYALGFCLVAALSCSDDNVTPAPDLGPGADMGNNTPDFPVTPQPDQGEPDLPTTPDMDLPDQEVDLPVTAPCRQEAPGDRPRKLVVAKPYDSESMPANAFDVYDLGVDGTFTSVSATFQLGDRARGGTIVFTPDGEVGIVRLDNGKLGSFKFVGNDVEVLQADFDPGEYISDLYAPPGDGRYVYGVKVGWRVHNSGLFRIPVDCETGMLGTAEMIAPAKLLYGVVFDGDKRAFLAATDVLDSEDPNHIHEFVIEPVPERLQSGKAFPDEDAILAGFDITPDASLALVGDTNLFGTHRIGVVKLEAPITPLQVLDVEDPESIVISPYGNAALVASVFGDALFVLDIDTTNATTPVSVRGELSTTEPVRLPDNLVMLRRGSLNGNVWVSENVGIRRVRFEPNGTVTDVSYTPTGTGVAGIPGAFGITP